MYVYNEYNKYKYGWYDDEYENEYCTTNESNYTIQFTNDYIIITKYDTYHESITSS